MFTSRTTTGVTSVGFLLLLGGLSHKSPTVTGEAVSYCSAYCDSKGQQVNEFPCSSNSTNNSTSVIESFCCGTATQKFCCSDPRQQVSLPPKTDCKSGNNDKDDEGNNMGYDWILIISIMMTVGVFLLGMVGCLCLCHRHCDCKNTVYSENGEMIRQTVSSSHPTSDLPQTSTRDFDPNSPFAFVPPPYDTLDKEPPSYCEIFTISYSCNGETRANQTSASAVASSNGCHVNSSGRRTRTVRRSPSRSRRPSVLNVTEPPPPYCPRNVTSSAHV